MTKHSKFGDYQRRIEEQAVVEIMKRALYDLGAAQVLRTQYVDRYVGYVMCGFDDADLISIQTVYTSDQQAREASMLNSVNRMMLTYRDYRHKLVPALDVAVRVGRVTNAVIKYRTEEFICDAGMYRVKLW
jgi:hypothetical protein